MSDVLMYNALKEYFVLNKRNIENQVNRTTGFPVVKGADAFTSNTASGYACTCGVATTTGVTYPTYWGNAFTESWATIPQLTTATCGFKVCDTSGLFRCGACCLWTVPAGVTRAQFQIWGPGGGTSMACCCGGSPFGPSGAYASVIMNVSAGQQFTLCAGCAVCAYACAIMCPGWGCPLRGNASFVSGPNINMFCAEGGNPFVKDWMIDVGHACSGSYCWVPTSSNCGPDACYGYQFCFDQCNDGGCTYYAYANNVKFYANVTGATGYGINGMWPIVSISKSCWCFGNCYESNNYTVAAPIFGFLDESQCIEIYNICCCYYRTGNSRSWLSGGGRMGIPGQGGYAGQVYAGLSPCCCDSKTCGSPGGDAGRMGMVCVRMC